MFCICNTIVVQIDSPEKAGFVAGGKIDVKHIGQNDKGQMRLSRRAALLRDSPTTATGAPLNPASATASAAAAASKLKAISSAAEAAYNSE